MDYRCPFCSKMLFKSKVYDKYLCENDACACREMSEQFLKNWYGLASKKDDEINPHAGKCTCGSAAVKGPGHSDWCDINKPRVKRKEKDPLEGLLDLDLDIDFEIVDPKDKGKK